MKTTVIRLVMFAAFTLVFYYLLHAGLAVSAVFGLGLTYVFEPSTR